MTEIAAHRGGAALWPENSAAAFEGAARLGVEQVEFDVQLSADGVPVVFHDATLERMTDGAGPLAERTLAELRTLRIKGDGGAILTLEQALDILGPTTLTLRCEIKPGPDMIPYPGIVDRTLEAFARRGLLERAVVTSFHLPTLGAVGASASPPADRIWLVATPVLRLLSHAHVAAAARREGVGAVSIRLADLDEVALAGLREAGLLVGAYAVLDDAEIARALGLGLTVFTTDRPDAALKLRDGVTQMARDR